MLATAQPSYQFGAIEANRSPCAAYRHDTDWPISSLALASLVDLGMSDALIGRYYAVSVAEVAMLRSHYTDRER